MCRIFCSPDRSLQFNEEDLWEYFFRLEKSLGKDGNGLYNFTTKELWKNHDRMPTEANIDGGILFHTRYATNGLVRDYNCQPFDNKNYVIVHNGSFSDIDTHARLLGFQYSTKKYSDTYMMAWVIERVGIFSFYNSFKDKNYGVVLVYDKKTEKLYLLKSGGSFEYGEFDSGIYIYGSASLDFWGLEEKAKSFSSGLYILSGTEFTQIHKPTTYVSTYKGTYKGGYNDNYGYNNDYYGLKKERKKKGRQEKIIINIKEDDNDIPSGIGSLFEDIIPKECHGCNWVYQRKCWFGGVERFKPINISDPVTNSIICNTLTATLDVIATCSECNMPLSKGDKWGIVNDVIMCRECEIDMYYEGRKCEDCKYFDEPSGIEPCASCFNENYIPRKWVESKKKSDICHGCYYEKDTLMTDYPCKICEENYAGMTEWTQQNGEERKVCDECGFHFEDWDNPIEDKNGLLTCWECLHEGRNDEDKGDYWKEYYEMDDYKNGKWRYR